MDGYFETGARVTAWMGGEVRKYHRTVENCFVGLPAAGLVVEALRQARPRCEVFQDEQTFLRRKRIPLFLTLAARKP